MPNATFSHISQSISQMASQKAQPASRRKGHHRGRR